MFAAVAVDATGKVFRVSAPTRQIAERSIVREIEKRTGRPYVRTAGKNGLFLALPAEAFAELPTKDNCTTICFPVRDGRIECCTVCRGNDHSSFSEKRGGEMGKRVRRFDDDEQQPMDRDNILDALAEAGGNRQILDKIPDDALAEVAKLLLGDSQNYIDGGKRKVGKFAEAHVSFAERGEIERFCESFNETARKNRRPLLDTQLFKDGYAAFKKYNPDATFEDFCRP